MTEKEALQYVYDVQQYVENNGWFGTEEEEALDMAWSALFDNVPRVLGKSELQETKGEITAYIEEWNEPPYCHACAIETIDKSCAEISTLHFHGSRLYSDYAIEWRCWNVKPTNEQMAAEPWSES